MPCKMSVLHQDEDDETNDREHLRVIGRADLRLPNAVCGHDNERRTDQDRNDQQSDGEYGPEG